MSTLPRVRYTHAGVFTSDLGRSVRFYRDVLGFVTSDEGVASTGHDIVFMTQDPTIHHQLVLFSGRPADLPFNPVNQLSFLLDGLEELRFYRARLRDLGYANVEEVDHGNAWSLYFADPDGNPIELYVDSPFYTPQPCRKPLDLAQPAEEILRRTEEMCRSRPDFLTRDAWIARTQARIERERA